MDAGTPCTPVDDSRLSASIDEELEPTLDLLGRLIAEESVDGSEAIARCLAAIDDAVQPLGGRRRRLEFDGLPNLVADWGAGDDRRLILAGHTDVVPAEGEWETDPFSLVRQDDTLIGRGVCDMKGALAAYVGALKVVARHGELDRLPVSLVVSGDEEVGSPRGMVPLLEGGHISGRWALCGEPTGLDVFTGNPWAPTPRPMTRRGWATPGSRPCCAGRAHPNRRTPPASTSTSPRSATRSPSTRGSSSPRSRRRRSRRM